MSLMLIFTDFSVNSIKESLLKTIKYYESEFSIKHITESNNKENSTYKKILNEGKYSVFDKYVLNTLQWAYQHFAYNRKQSLKNIYELCGNFKILKRAK